MKKLIVAVFLMVISAAGIAAQVQIPPIARVVDTSGTLTQAQISSLTARGNELEKATGTVVVSLIVPTTGDESIDDFSMRVAESWHPGKAGVDRAAVLVIAKNDKKWAIKTSRNTGVTLTDVRTKVTLNKMGAYLKDHKGDFAGAIGVFYSEIEPFIKADTLSPVPVTPAKEDSSWSTMLWFFGAFGAIGAALVIGIWWKVQREKAEAERLRRERESEEAYRAILRRNEIEARRLAQVSSAAIAAAASPWPRKSYKQPVSTVEPTKKRVVERVRDTTIVPVVTTVPTYSSSRDDDDDYSRRSSSYSSSSSSDSYSSWDSSSSSSSSSSFDGGGSSSSFD